MAPVNFQNVSVTQATKGSTVNSLKFAKMDVLLAKEFACDSSVCAILVSRESTARRSLCVQDLLCPALAMEFAFKALARVYLVMEAAHAIKF